MSHPSNLTVEIPLKAIIRGYSFAVVSNDWINCKSGLSTLKLNEMGSRYLFIVLYCFAEKWLSKENYHRQEKPKRWGRLGWFSGRFCLKRITLNSEASFY